VSVAATVLLDVMDLSGVFCVADSGVLQDTILWNSVGMHTCSVWFSNTCKHPGQTSNYVTLGTLAYDTGQTHLIKFGEFELPNGRSNGLSDD